MTSARRSARALGASCLAQLVWLAPAAAFAEQVSAGLFSCGSGAAQSPSFRLRAHAIGQTIGGNPTLGPSFGLSPGAQIAGGAGLDTDGDGLSDATEGALGTNLHAVDTDSDGLSDFDEVNYDGNPGYRPGADTDPLDPDTDGDGLLDGRDPDPLEPEAPQVPALPAAAWLALALSLAGVGKCVRRRDISRT